MQGVRKNNILRILALSSHSTQRNTLIPATQVWLRKLCVHHIGLAVMYSNCKFRRTSWSASFTSILIEYNSWHNTSLPAFVVVTYGLSKVTYTFMLEHQQCVFVQLLASCFHNSTTFCTLAGFCTRPQSGLNHQYPQEVWWQVLQEFHHPTILH